MTEPYDDLERRLAATFQRQAAQVTVPAAWHPPAEQPARPGETIRLPDRGTVHPGRPRRMALLTAAAVVALVVGVTGTVLGIRHRTAGRAPVPPLASTQPPPTAPAPSGRPCTVPAPESWSRAATASAVPLDRPGVDVLSANGSLGDYLVSQSATDGYPGAGSSLAVFHGRTGVDLAAPPPAGNEIVVADPSSAITAGWLTWGVTLTQNDGAYYRVELYDRTHHTLRQPAALAPSAQDSRLFLGAPVLTDTGLYWLQSVYGDPAHSVLHAYDLADGTQTERPVPGATRLVGYGTGLALAYGADARTTLRNAVGQPLPPDVLTAAAGAVSFGYSTGTLSWSVFTPGASAASNAYFRYRLGGASAPAQVRVPGPELLLGPDSYPLLSLDPTVAQRLYVDLRTGARVTLPAGLGVAAVLGTEVLLQTGSGKLGASGLSLVPLASLPPARC
ncbi:MAG TPA: hypothetical protein VMB79_18395 [Jatrophihabitans sp.]|nr:hypothetical protein [Jatrophihabitans sp.]